VAAAHAVEHVGLPECAHNLAQACVYLALAPKSNAAYKALGAARAWVRENGVPDIPHYLRSGAYPGAERLGRGQGYEYPHDEPDAVSGQELMPPEAEGVRFLELTEQGEEAELRERDAELRRRRRGS
jgi:putative ATPase